MHTGQLVQPPVLHVGQVGSVAAGHGRSSTRLRSNVENPRLVRRTSPDQLQLHGNSTQQGCVRSRHSGLLSKRRRREVAGSGLPGACKKPRYDVVPSALPVWLSSVADNVASLVGLDVAHPLVVRAAAVIGSSLQPSTMSGYSVKWAYFAKFCKRHGFCAFPASTATCLLYATELFGGGSLKASSIPQYLSAINTVHAQCVTVF